MNTNTFDVPILLIAFNRPETTCHIFEQIRKVKPSRLYIFQDASKDSNENDLTETCRYLLDDSQINWQCNVERWSPEQNLGMAIGISSAITWAFETCSQLIVLEDDCLPHPSFFTYCRYMLHKYENNDRVMHISGTSHTPSQQTIEHDHHFSRIGHIAGWATWKRAWTRYDFWMESYPEMVKERKIQQLFGDIHIADYWHEKFQHIYNQSKKKSWNYQWQYTLFQNYGLCVVPNVNLISNIGIEREDAASSGTYFLETTMWKNSKSDVSLFIDNHFEVPHFNVSLYKKPTPRLLLISWVKKILRSRKFQFRYP